MDYAPNTDTQLDSMLGAIGVGSFEELIRSIPENLRQRTLDIPEGLAEEDVLRLCGELASRNRPASEQECFLGAGAYQHLVPTVVDAIAQRGEWLTPYTPYQAEASQGILQAMYEFQTMVCELMEMEVANASLYDGATSLAEAAVLALRATGRKRILVSEAVHPHARQVLSTYLQGSGAAIQVIPTVNGVTDLEALSKAVREDVACVLFQHPNVFGCLEPMVQAGELAHRAGSLFVASVYPISLGLVQPPGSYGADIAVAEGRCLGTPLSYGGPGLGIFATTQALMRKLPGRIAGCTLDAAGNRAFTLTLQTREQHIRRERATSNICTNQGLVMLRATLYMSLLGASGMRELAQRNLDHAHAAHKAFLSVPWISPVFEQPFFNEFALRYESHLSPKRVNQALAKEGILGGLPLADWYPHCGNTALWCVTETNRWEAIDRTVEVLKGLT